MRALKAILFVFLGIAIIFGITSCTPVDEKENKPIELTYATPYSPMHAYSRADMAWIEKIEKETNGRVTIKTFWAGTLVGGSEGITELANGVADIVHIIPIYENAGLEIIKAQPAFFQGMTDLKAELEIFWKLWEAFPEMRKELDRIKVITAHTGAPMHLLTTEKPVRSLEDLKGIRMKAPKEIIPPLQKLGAEGIIMPMTEAYIGLQKGIIKGVWSRYETLKSMKFAEVVKYYNKLPTSRGVYPSRAMNWDSWNRLPRDIQKIIEESGDWWGSRIIEEAAKDDEEGIAYGKGNGVQFIEIPESELNKWMDILEEHAVSEAKRLDAMGLPGTKIYEMARPLVKATFN